MSVKKSVVLLSLWMVFTFIIYCGTKFPDSYTRNLPGSGIFALFIVCFLWGLWELESKGREFVINDLVYNTATASVIAEGKERSKYLGANWGSAAWRKSRATFYQTENGALFSVDASHVLEMALFVPVPRSHAYSCTVYTNKKECMDAMVSKAYGGLSAKAVAHALGVSFKAA